MSETTAEMYQRLTLEAEQTVRIRDAAPLLLAAIEDMARQAAFMQDTDPEQWTEFLTEKAAAAAVRAAKGLSNHP